MLGGASQTVSKIRVKVTVNKRRTCARRRAASVAASTFAWRAWIDSRACSRTLVATGGSSPFVAPPRIFFDSPRASPTAPASAAASPRSRFRFRRSSLRGARPRPPRASPASFSLSLSLPLPPPSETTSARRARGALFHDGVSPAERALWRFRCGTCERRSNCERIY